MAGSSADPLTLATSQGMRKLVRCREVRPIRMLVDNRFSAHSSADWSTRSCPRPAYGDLRSITVGFAFARHPAPMLESAPDFAAPFRPTAPHPRDHFWPRWDREPFGISPV